MLPNKERGTNMPNAKEKTMVHETPKKTKQQEHHFVKQTLKQQIEKKAYELYEERGRIGGRQVEDWLEAEKLVIGCSQS